MRKKYKVGLIIITILILLMVALGVSKFFIKDDKPKKENVTNVVSNIKDYGYTLDDRDTEYMKETFEELKNVLNEKEIDYQAYASLIAKLFVTDFYTLNNKINKYDVGSLEYIYNEALSSFKNKAMDTIYADIIDNTYKDRIQDLPEITNVDVIGVTEDKVKLKDKELDAYKVTAEYTYKEDMGYDKEGTIYLVKNANKLEVAVYEPKINN